MKKYKFFIAVYFLIYFVNAEVLNFPEDLKKINFINLYELESKKKTAPVK